MTMRIGVMIVGILLSLRGLCAPGGSFVFLADSVNATTGSTVGVGIRALHFDSLISFQGSLSFNASVVSLVGVQNYGLPSMGANNFGFSYAQNGFLTFSWNDLNLSAISVPDSTLLFELLFQVNGVAGTQVPINFVNYPTPIEVVDYSYSVVGFTHLNGNIEVVSVPVCHVPDSLSVTGIGSNAAQLNWISSNPGAAYVVEWGHAGFSLGNGSGMMMGNTVAGVNAVNALGLNPNTAYAFYVLEDCGSIGSNVEGPVTFETEARALPHATVMLFADSVLGEAGDDVVVYVRAKNFTDMISAQGTLSWDPGVARLDSVRNFGLPSMGGSNFGMGQAASGVLTFSWNDPSLQGVDSPNDSALFGLHYHLVGAAGTNTPVAFVQSPLALELSDTSFNTVPDSTVDGFIRINDSVLIGLPENLHPIIKAFPNPLPLGADRFYISIIPMAVQDLVAVRMRNTLGQTLAQEGLSWKAESGLVTCELLAPLPSGLWLLEVETTQTILYCKMLINGK